MSLLSTEDRQIIIQFALERGWDKKIAKKDGTRTESLLTHHLKTLSILDSLFSIIRDDLNFSDDDLRIALLSSMLHDVGKRTLEWQQKIISGSKKFVSHVNRDISKATLADLLDRLPWTISPGSFKNAVNAIMQHMGGSRKSPTDTLESIRDSPETAARWVSISHLISFADRLASIPDPADCLRVLSGTGFSRLADLIELDYHKVNQIRGISTTLLHTAVERAMSEVGWSPILFFSLGTIYLRRKTSSENQTFVWDSFEDLLEQTLDAFLDHYQDNESETIVGNPTASMITLPRLFDWDHIDSYFEVAMNRTGIKSPSSITSKKVRKYLTTRAIREKHGFDRAMESLRPRSYKKKYGSMEEPSISEDAPLFGQIQREFAEINPEATLFKFFKAIFTDSSLYTPEMLQKAEEEYDALFGEGEFQHLTSMATLIPVRDRLTAIDNYWSLPASNFDSEKGGIIKDLPAKTRQQLLKEALVDISKKAYAARSQELSRGYIKIIKDIARTDLINPSPHAPSSLKEQAQTYLEHWSESKHAQKSKRYEQYICPRCNQRYDEGNLVAAEISGFKKKFSNRVLGGTRISDGISICTSCELELLLRYISLGRQTTDLVVFYPEISIQRDLGSQIIDNMASFEKGLREIGPFRGENEFEAFSFRMLSSAARQITADPSVLTSLRDHRVVDLMALFTYERTQESAQRVLQQAFEETVAKLELDLSPLPDVSSLDEAISLITEEASGIPSDLVRDDLLQALPSGDSGLSFFHQTPNYFIWSASQSLVSFGDESDVNLAIKNLFIGTLLSLFTGYSVALLSSEEKIPSEANGAVYIPANPHIRRLFNNQSWLSDSDVLSVCRQIASAIVIAERAAYPSRSALYAVLSEPLKGKVLRRIEQKQDYGVTISDIENLETIFGRD